MSDPFIAFLEKPTGDTFSQLRSAVVEAPEYDFYSNDLEEMEQLAAAKNFPAAADRWSVAMPSWLLSPRMHQLIGDAARQTGNKDLAAREDYLVKACLRGLTASGDGSEQRPYLVTHASDEYDVLGALGKDPIEQRQVTTDRGVFDVINCTDGAKLWFDITPSLKTHSLA